jgi:hypothetical protein
MKSSLKIKIPIGILFEKLNLFHKKNNEDLNGENTFKNKYNIKVKTPNGYKKINFFVTKKSDVYKYTLENSKTLITSNKHLIIENKKQTQIQNAKSVDNIDGNSYKIISKELIKNNEIVYDFGLDSPHLYTTPDGSIHHNTTIAQYIFLYDMCRMLCMTNPQEKFNLPNNTVIKFALTNATLDAAESINLDPIMGMLRKSPFFVSKFSKDKKDKSTFKNNIDLFIASSKRQLVGKNIYSAISDEINQEVIKGGSSLLVAEMINRINSRFLMKGDRWPCHYVLISSTQDDSSLVEKIKENFEDSMDSIKLISPARFEVKGHLDIYGGEKFKVFIGNYSSDPFIIQTKEELILAEEIDIEKIHEVPIEHYLEFKQNIYSGIQDVLGKVTVDSATFIKDKTKIKKMLTLSSTCDKEVYILNHDENSPIIDYFEKERLVSFGLDHPRVIALDIATTEDRFGFTMLHRRYDPKYERQIQDRDGTIEDFVYWSDLCIAFVPEEGKKIPLWKVRDFIRDLKDLGFPIKIITSDSYQSFDTLQLLEKDGFTVMQCSVDKKKNAYYTLRNAINEEKIKVSNNDILFEELVSLIENEKKIDHPSDRKSAVPSLMKRELNISKDLADSLTAALFVFKDVEIHTFENLKPLNELKEMAGTSVGNKLFDKLIEHKNEEFNLGFDEIQNTKINFRL